MEVFPLFKSSFWIYLLLSLSFVDLSEQNDTGDQLEKLETLINDKFTALSGMFTEMDTKLGVMKEKLDYFETVVDEKINNDNILLKFNPSNVTFFVGEEARFDCGILGVYNSCNWENKGIIYQLSDIKNGSYSNFAALSSNSINQCGIVISPITSDQGGVWSCNVLAFGNTLVASKTVNIEITGMIFNTTPTFIWVGQEQFLMCGVDGIYESCQWEHNNRIYQVADIKNGSYSDLKSLSTTVNDECSIIIHHANKSHDGVWSCKILTIGQTLSASKTVNVDNNRVIFNPTNITASVGQEIYLDCGIIGVYSSCYWQHNNFRYQVANIKGGSYSNLKAEPNSKYNECGIQIKSANASHHGVWSCHVISYGQTFELSRTLGQTVELSKTVHIECSEGEGFFRSKFSNQCMKCEGDFFKSQGSDQCFIHFNDTKHDWNAAKSNCESKGLRLAEPNDYVAVNLRKDLIDRYGSDMGPWLGARGVGNSFAWESSGAILRSDNPLMDDRSSGSIGYCLELDQSLNEYNAAPGKPYDGQSCTEEKYTLCEVIWA